MLRTKNIALCILSGLLIGLSLNRIGNIPLAPLAWFCLVPLFFALREDQNKYSFFLKILLFTAAYVVSAFITFLLKSVWGGILLLFLGTTVLSIPYWIIYFVRKKIGYNNSLWILAFIWPAYEWFTIDKLLHIPLLAIPNSQGALPWLIQYIDITGYTSITFWIFALNVVLYLTIEKFLSLKTSNSPKKKESLNKFFVKRFSWIILLFFGIPIIYNAYAHQNVSKQLYQTIRVTCVQPNYIFNSNPTDSDYVRIVKRAVALTDSALKKDSTDLIVWPESGVPLFFKENKNVHDYIFTKVLKWQKPLLTGTFDKQVIHDTSKIPPLEKYLHRNYYLYNSAVMVTPQLAWAALFEKKDISSLKLYRKQNLMPFTEHVPFSRTFPVLAQYGIDLGGYEDLTPGKGPVSLNFAYGKGSVASVSPIICWDLLYSVSNIFSKSNCDFIAALINMSDFGDKINATALEMVNFAALRSIETRRSVVETSTSGYTFFSSPFGEISGRLPWFKRGVTTGDIYLSSITTFNVKHPNLFPEITLIIAIILFLILNKKSSSPKIRLKT